jgi:hypothetical protein
MRKHSKNISEELAYLLGLITGRGHIFANSKTVAVEFSHANEFAYGIIHCRKCGDLVTKQVGGDKLICKNCGTQADPKDRASYNQPLLTIESLKEVIIPFLKSEIRARFDITGNKAMTLLVMDFKENAQVFEVVKGLFNGGNGFDTFHIPDVIHTASREAKIEFVNGLFDTAGFASPGGWLNRQGKKMQGRMRVYFQIVRNWYLPVEIDNFLRKEFSLPTHTIDWGHPNIRDANMSDYFEQRPTSWSREHQIKFFPEYYTQFKFRVKSKQLLFNELADHNKRAVFNDLDDWFPPGPIPASKVKAYHPGESDLRIPEPARHHFNAFWQINAVMGCSYLKELITKAKNPEYFFLTGKDEDGDIEVLKKQLDATSKKLQKEIFAAHTEKSVAEKSKAPRTTREALEKDLYGPLVIHLKKYLGEKYNESVEVFDTSAGNLNLFLKNKNTELFQAFDFCEKFRIRPDVVGFLSKSKKLVFEEAKVTQLDLKALGQLLGYCFVAQPEEAILISSKKPSIALIKVLKARPDLLEYGMGKKIQIGTWQNGNLELLNV